MNMRLQQPQINHKMRATMKDGRQLVGQMLAFDKVRNCNTISDTQQTD
jgi:small nuclear ribonucleoprotein (snRNP)-like protein